MASSESRPAPARERSAARPEPPLTAIEAVLICGVLAAALVSCWKLYGPLIEQMVRLMK